MSTTTLTLDLELDALEVPVPNRGPLHLLVTIALPQICEYSGPVGRLLTPRHYPRIEDTILAGIPWALDNDAYSGFDEDRFLRMLDKAAQATDAAVRFTNNAAKFVTAPDVVGEAAPTLELFDKWEPIIRAAGLPVALVAQDGLEDLVVPWDRMDALFIGGSTEWKLGDAARRLTFEAKARGLWAHMGRVNSFKRLRIAASFGCDSADGSKWARFRNTYMPDGTAFLRDLERDRLELERSTT